MPLTGLRSAKRLRDDFAWVLVGNVIYSASQWGIVVALAKLGSAAQVGEYALGVAISSPIIVFANLQLRALVASEVKDRVTFGHYLAFRLASLGAALAITAAVAVSSQPDWGLRGIVILTGLVQSLEAFSDTYYGLMQKCGRMDRVSISLALRGPFSLAALCAVMYRTHSVILAVVALLAARLLVLIGWDMRLGFAHVSEPHGRGRLATKIHWEAGSMFSLLRLALPLGVISMLLSLNSNLPRYFLEAHSGSAELGIFSALASLLTAGNLVVSAFGQSVYQPVARACADADRARFRVYSLVALLLGGGMGVAFILGATLFGRTILVHVFRPEYANHAGALVRLTFAGTVLFIGSSVGYVITGARRLGPQIPVMVLSCVASAAVSAWSIQANGLNGAADAMLAAGLVQLAGVGTILWKIDRHLGGCAPDSPVSEESRPAAAVC